MEFLNSKQYYEYVYSKTLSNTNIQKFFTTGIPKEAVYYIVSEYQKGKRSNSIYKDFKIIFSSIPESSLSDITQTICSIASSAETQFKSKISGMNWYVWSTSEDRSVRSSHELMQDVIVNFDTPPSPEELSGEKSIGNYHAGESFKCRCYPSPIVRLDFIKWPHMVYYNNTLQNMNREQFEAIK